MHFHILTSMDFYLYLDTILIWTLIVVFLIIIYGHIYHLNISATDFGRDLIRQMFVFFLLLEGVRYPSIKTLNTLNE